MDMSPELRTIPAARTAVRLHADEAHQKAHLHERQSREVFAARLAAFMSLPVVKTEAAGEHAYLLPGAVLSASEARTLGVRGEDHIFGGVVPHAFVGTKVITHRLVSEEAVAPEGWSRAFSRAVSPVVLTGFSAFSREDALSAGLRLLAHGAVRLKPPGASAGRDQVVCSSVDALKAELSAVEDSRFAREGLVLEENLRDVTTYSVGQVRIAGAVASYWGVQRLTKDNRGSEVYGGSDLLVTRGDYGALLAHPDLPAHARRLVEYGGVYDGAAMRCFPGLIASRRNYDVVEGVNDAGERRCGVLEQSWRMGGASGAELAALEAFKADPALSHVRAATFEEYGGVVPPGHAVIYFDGEDADVGPISRYTLVTPR